MTFEEFFKKKRIDLVALKAAEPALFSEFEAHYHHMGEKSFDHTKKYWFNKLRRAYPLAPEVKTEKVHIANPLAEQTITESLIETTVAPSPAKLGFVPKFKAGNMPKPSDKPVNTDEAPPAAENSAPTVPVDDSPGKPAYQPRFKMKPKADESGSASSDLPLAATTASPQEDQPIDTVASTVPERITKSAYQPRFKMKPKAEESENTASPGLAEKANAPTEENKEQGSAPEVPENAPAQPAYKPRFNMKNIKPKDQE